MNVPPGASNKQKDLGIVERGGGEAYYELVKEGTTKRTLERGRNACCCLLRGIMAFTCFGERNESDPVDKSRQTDGGRPCGRGGVIDISA